MRYLARGVAVIGHYDSAIYDADSMGKALINISKNLGLCNSGCGAWPGASWTDIGLAAEVRSPKDHEGVKASGMSLRWHHDGGHDSKTAMVIWSNREQTEIKLPDETVLRPEPGDVLLVANQVVEHRTPELVSDDRWFFRRTVDLPKWMWTE